MTKIQESISALPDDEFRDLKAWVVTTETDRRAAQPAVEQARAEVVTELQDAGKLEKPEAATEEQAKEDTTQVPKWEDPGTDHSKMYHYGDVLEHKGNIVRSTHRGLNHWEPGTLAFDQRIWEIIGTVAQGTEPETETEDTPETDDAPETDTEDTGVQAWTPNLNVKPGQRYTFQGDTYEVIQGHTSAAHWPPNAVPALYKKV